MKTKTWCAMPKKLFTREDVAEAERLAKREIHQLELLQPRRAGRKNQTRHA